jgi:hypothetical protein
MKTLILPLALGIALVSPVVYADESPNLIEDLFYGSDHSHRAHLGTVDPPAVDPFKPRITDGLSRNPNACASYGCVDAGGG